MHLHLLLLLFSPGAFSYFLPLKETLRLQKTPPIIREMLCLLEAESKSTNMTFYRPLNIKDKNCAHSITQRFICELKKISTDECLKRVELDMKALERDCTVLRKSSSSDQECLKLKEEKLSGFKESLEEFLKWVNEKDYCKTLPRGSGFYLGGKCSCPGKWKDHRGLL